MDTAPYDRRMDFLIKKGLTPVEAAYQTLEECEQRDGTATRFACGAGCAPCCHQLVTCTSLEAAAIKKYLDSLPKRHRDQIKSRALTRARQWHTQQTTLQPGILVTTQDAADTVLDEWLGKPCPFLDEQQRCTVYPARPLSCRTHHSTSVCQRPLWPDAHMFVCDAEHWANDTINRLEQAVGPLRTSPLHAWLMTKQI